MTHPGVRAVVAELERVGSREMEDWVELRREQGGEVLTLRGGPVLSLPAHIRDTALAAFDEADRRPSRGLPELRHAIANELASESGAAVDPDHELLVTHGAMHGLNIVMRALLDPGDEVLIPTPNFFFEGIVSLAGGRPIYVPCDEDDGWRWDFDRIKSAITSRTKLFIVCNPTNPTGYLPSATDLDELVALADKRGFLILSDESYDRFTYDAAVFTSMVGMNRSAVVVRSLSKSHALANWRIGYVVAPSELLEGFTKVLEWDCLHCGYVPQRVAHAALSGPQDWLAGIPARYQANRDRLLAAVAESGWLSAAKPAAAPFLFLNTERAEQATGRSGAELLLEVGIPTVRGEYFRGPGHARLPIGADGPTLERLEQLLSSFSP